MIWWKRVHGSDIWSQAHEDMESSTEYSKGMKIQALGQVALGAGGPLIPVVGRYKCEAGQT